MNLNKRLMLYNSAILLIPLLITAVLGVILFTLSPYIFGGHANYDSVKKLTEMNYELLGTGNEQLNNNPDELIDKAYQEYMAAKFSGIGANIVILKNKEVVYSTKKLSKIEVQKCVEATKGNFAGAVVKLDDSSYFVKVISVRLSSGEDGMLFMLSPVEGDGKEATKLTVILVLIYFAFYFLTNIYYGNLISKKITQPLKKLQLEADKISSGNLNDEIYEQGEEDIILLYRSFEKMRLKLKESVDIQNKYEQNRTMLLSNISHDLRTPITTIKGYIEGILDGVADTEQKKEKYLKTAYQKAGLMDEMIDDILLYSKLDLNQLTFDFSKVNILEYTKDIVQDYEALLIKSNISISLVNELSVPTYVMLDTNKMIRVFNNIIENSKKYIKNYPGKIEIILREAKANVIIEVRDNGQGIDETALPSIFERFYRADKSRTNVNGSGLGLAICRQIVEGHKGRIWAKSKPGEGTSIIMSVPKVFRYEVEWDGKDFNNRG